MLLSRLLSESIAASAASAGAGLFQPALPFPRQLAAVPEIEGAHHESLDGRGYRRVLKAEPRGLLAGVMAIADILKPLPQLIVPTNAACSSQKRRRLWPAW